MCSLVGKLCDMDPVLDVTNPDTWPEWLMISELATVLRVSEPTAVKLVDSGLLPYVDVGSATRKVRRFRKADVLNLPTARETPMEKQDPTHSESPT